MNSYEVKYWNGKKVKLIQKFPVITDKDVRFHLGKEKEMLDLLGAKLGKTNQELLYIIVDL